MLTGYYCSFITNNGLIPVYDTVSVNSILETISFTETDVIVAINKLKPNLSAGPDRLPPTLF